MGNMFSGSILDHAKGQAVSYAKEGWKPSKAMTLFKQAKQTAGFATGKTRIDNMNEHREAEYQASLGRLNSMYGDTSSGAPTKKTMSPRRVSLIAPKSGVTLEQI